MEILNKLPVIRGVINIPVKQMFIGDPTLVTSLKQDEIIKVVALSGDWYILTAERDGGEWGITTGFMILVHNKLMPKNINNTRPKFDLSNIGCIGEVEILTGECGVFNAKNAIAKEQNISSRPFSKSKHARFK